MTKGGAPVLSIFGGKITTYRVLALKAMKTLKSALGIATNDWTADANLPGGDFPVDGFDALVARYGRTWSFVDRAVMIRMVRAYGTDTAKILVDADYLEDLGQNFGAGLFECEIQWLVEKEFARTAEDVLWRRSKLGLHMTVTERASVQSWFDNLSSKTEVTAAVS